MSKPKLSKIQINAAQMNQILTNRGLPGLQVRDLVVPGSIEGEPPYQGGQPPRQDVEFPDGGGSAPPPSGEIPPDQVPPVGYYDAPPSSYAAAQYDAIGGSGMNGYYLAGPHPYWMPAGPHNRPATKAAAEQRYTEMGAILEAHQETAGFTGAYPRDQNECVARESETRRVVGDQDHKDCGEWFLLRHVMGLGGG